jgi:signal transduction histidine kinase
MKLTARVASFLPVFLLVVGTSCIVRLRSLTELDVALAEVVETEVPRLLAITDLRRFFRTMVVLERDGMLTTDAAARGALDARMMTARRQLDAGLDRYEGLAVGEDRAPLVGLRRAYAQWKAEDETVLSLSRAGKREAARALAQARGHDAVSWEAIITDLVERNERRIAEQTAATRASHRSASNVLAGLGASATLVTCLLAALVGLRIKRSLAETEARETNLETLVEERARALQERERSLRELVDSTGEGILAVDLEGRLTGERSRAIYTWFGPPGSKNAPVASYLGAQDVAWSQAFAAGFAQLAEDVLPFELSAGQMPSALERGASHYALRFRQVFEGGVFARVLIVITDVSDRIEGERAARGEQERQVVLGHLFRDEAAFRDAVWTCEKLLGELHLTRDPEDLVRDVRRLAERAGANGFASIGEQCRKMEGSLAGTDDGAAAQLAELSTLWRARIESLRTYLHAAPSGALTTLGPGRAAVLARHLHGDRDDLIGAVDVWSWGRTSEFLARLRAQADRVSGKLGKHVSVQIEHNGLRIPPGPLDAFWPTLIHVIRNAVDHGIEGTDERVAAGKSDNGQLRLCTRLDVDRSLLVEVRDDGRGLDVEAIKAAARRHGLRATTTEDVVAALFTDGLSTRSEVTETSGRGVGMASVRDACTAAGGSVSVETTTGKGTAFIFRFPPLPRPRSVAPPPRSRPPSRAPNCAA